MNKSNEDETLPICIKAVSLELALKDVRLGTAFEIHKDYKDCIENKCPGYNKDCEYFRSQYLMEKL